MLYLLNPSYFLDVVSGFPDSASFCILVLLYTDAMAEGISREEKLVDHAAFLGLSFLVPNQRIMVVSIFLRCSAHQVCRRYAKKNLSAEQAVLV